MYLRTFVLSLAALAALRPASCQLPAACTHWVPSARPKAGQTLTPTVTARLWAQLVRRSLNESIFFGPLACQALSTERMGPIRSCSAVRHTDVLNRAQKGSSSGTSASIHTERMPHPPTASSARHRETACLKVSQLVISPCTRDKATSNCWHAVHRQRKRVSCQRREKRLEWSSMSAVPEPEEAVMQGQAWGWPL